MPLLLINSYVEKHVSTHNVSLINFISILLWTL